MGKHYPSKNQTLDHKTSKYHLMTREEVCILMKEIPNVYYLEFSFQQLSLQY